MKRAFEDFTRLYPLSKTLRFELKPVGATLDNFLKSGILEQDEHRADSYQKVKKLIDEYHKVFIDRVMSDFSFSLKNRGKLNSLSEYSMYYSQKGNNEESKKHFVQLQKNLRKAIANVLKKDQAFKRIDKKELIEQDLIEFINGAAEHQLQGLTKQEAFALVAEFKGFTTYFGGFHQNRANMYSAEEQSTAIAYRLVNDNLPRFIDNAKVFQEVEKVLDIQQIYEAYKSVLSVQSIQEMFQLEYYNKVLTQNQIDLYNSIIGGKTLEEGQERELGLNEYIHLYNSQQDDKPKLPKLKPLYKQILSDRLIFSWLPEEFKSDQQMLHAIQACYEQLSNFVLKEENLKHLLESLSDYDLNGIYLRNDKQIASISQKAYGSWNVIEKAIKSALKKREEPEEIDEKQISDIKQIESFSIQYINECVIQYFNEVKETDDSSKICTIESYFQNLDTVTLQSEQRENLFDRIEKAYADVASLLRDEDPRNKRLAQDKENVECIKNLLDAIKALQRFVKPLLGKGDESGKDERFYGEFSILWNQLDSFTSLYNRVRNHMTKKPYSEEKIKLNFENATLLEGWDENKEKAYACSILRRNGLYYLAILKKTIKDRKKKTKASPYKKAQSGEMFYEKMVYKQFDLLKQLPKCTTETKQVKNALIELGQDSCVCFDKKTWNAPLEVTKEIWQLNNQVWDDKKKCLVRRKKDDERPKKFQKKYLEKSGDRIGYEEAKNKWIAFAKQFIAAYKSTSIYRIQYKNSYDSVDDFYKHLKGELYKISFENISAEELERQVEEGNLDLFQIYNKDFSRFSKGTPNLHTLYWKALFSEENLKDVVYKLDGQAEVFYRKKSLSTDHPTHPANIPIRNKQNHKKGRVLAYDLIKDRRYTVDKFMFHVPITMNYKSYGSNEINQAVLEYLQTAEDVHMIGIDRGERHLLYLVVIDRHGTIKEQFSLNEIANINYHDLLDTREKERQEARQSWQTIENIKELKEGYLSQAIHKIVQLMVKYHAIVVLEDLNFGFMRSRQKIEKQVYQKFEKMLIDKLNYLVDKKTEANQPGGLFHAYQLAEPFESFRELGKQSGFLFYVPAWNTSKIDPVTGFVNLLEVEYSRGAKAKDLFSQFQSIRYNDEKDWFEFTLDYASIDNNGAKEKAKGTKTQWTLCTQGERIETIRDKNKKWCSQRVNPTQLFKDLFRNNHIDIHGDLKEAISKQDDTELKKNDKKFFEELMRCLKLTLQMRNSEIGTEVDYLISPVIDEYGRSYDSRTCGEDLPQNADANGAYNIARKGLMMVDQIRKAEDLKSLKFDLSNKSWLNFAQQKPYLHD